MLSIYCIGATFWQSWRIKNVCNKISDQLAQQASVVFYTLSANKDDGFDATFATSDLCINRSAAKVSQILWLHGNQRGCSLLPAQTLQIMPWISFPEAPSFLPFNYIKLPEKLSERLVDRKNLLHLLLETDVQPNYEKGCNEEVVEIEKYGRLIAWKIDSHLALLVETDIEHFTKLLISTYLQNNILINDQLPLLRIESVNYEGKPQPFELVSSHLRKSTRQNHQLTVEEWQKHLEDLRSLSVLANQAIEFEYNKKRAEGKTGVIQPDLIPAEKKASLTKAENEMEVKKADKQIVSKDETDSSNKMKAKPTEIKKPTNILPSRFKTTKVEETLSNNSNEKASTATAIVATVTNLCKTNNAASIAKTCSSPSTLEKLELKPEPSGSSTALTQVAGNSDTSSGPSALEKLAAGIHQQQEKAIKLITPTKQPSKVSTDKTTLIKTMDTSASTEQAVVSTSTELSVTKDNTKRPYLRRNKDSLNDSKPLNILVYSESANARESAMTTLKELLECDMYTIYEMTSQQVEQKHWLDNTALLVVCGAVPLSVGEILMDYFLKGGKVLSLCSDILHFILPTYRTAEVREHELVQFSYGKWHKVKMMHHIFCYQPSPVKKHFSTDSEESGHVNSRKPGLVCPRFIELKGLAGEQYNLDVEVLGTEETWNTPSLLLAKSTKTGGKAVFSQVHLETSPSQFETDEGKYDILKANDNIRLDIFEDLLNKYLNISVRQVKSTSAEAIVYQNAYFLGRYENKFELLEKLKQQTGSTDNLISTANLSLQFCGIDDKPVKANNSVLPILVHSCPDNFSTVDYFDNLKTQYIGRLVIYAPIISSSMHVISDLELTHGIAVLPRQQTAGVGRSNNQWLSPMGCAMFSIQLHISMNSHLGSRLPLLQHVVGAAMTNTLKSHSLYQQLDIAIKWPNDIYANGKTKIGGLIVKTNLLGSNAIVNIGCAINLSNSKPTVCINDLINEHNGVNSIKLPILKYEQFIAMVFNEIERLVEQVQTGDFDSFYKLYYDLWLHQNQPIVICDKQEKRVNATVIGIDDNGFLKVKTEGGATEIVHPDGNTFDILKGLIVPKYY